MADEDEGESASDPSKIKITSCFLHFEGIKDCSSEITKQRIKKCLSCTRRWADLKGKEGDVARKSYELFEDKLLEDYLSSHAEFQFCWPYHKACYKKFCDVEKISRAEEKIAKDGSFQVIEGDAGDDGSAAGFHAFTGKIKVMTPIKNNQSHSYSLCYEQQLSKCFDFGSNMQNSN
eukprot:Seg4270.1 transcript_id=Seg4270.1/GoldUCD/mRNA.D3Y31 product="hypothetical protein" protein_id=Seg4270.1/GoldUCD/D3Y31